jgi:DNA mismatch repair protein MutS
MAPPLTPIRSQYLRIKARYPQAIVLFRLGDFYETFDDDARLVSTQLDITLTSREMGKGQKVPMAGIPYHSLKNHLAKLVERGYKVAICEQLTPPGKGLVERDVVQVVTPGTVADPEFIDSARNNFLVAVLPGSEESGLAFIDITTGEFATTQLSTAVLIPEINRLQPSEILIPDGSRIPDYRGPAPITSIPGTAFDPSAGLQVLLQHFGVSTIQGYGCSELPLAIGCAAAIIEYLKDNQKSALLLLDQLSTYRVSSFMVLDTQTSRNLELFNTAHHANSEGSLLSTIDPPRTAMGSRLLRKWLGQPLLDLNELLTRQQAVDWLRRNNALRHGMVAALKGVCDLERLMNRVRTCQALPRDVVAIGTALARLEGIHHVISGADAPAWLAAQIQECPYIAKVIETGISREPPDRFEDGGVISEGFDPELDGLRRNLAEAKHRLTELERSERQRTGIKSLKVCYNQVFGYYIEVSKANLKLVPEDYFRKQTLTDAERFYTPQLKEYETQIASTSQKTAALEEALFRRVCTRINEGADQILASARAIAQLDVLVSLAVTADKNRYVRPILNEGDGIEISGGRHPSLEMMLEGATFIANDTSLSNSGTQIMILTGPNMSGKSTYLKQVALIVLLAQVGSFVPAESATIGIVDRIFTRIGAQEDLMAGQSTFMVEMVETANILNNATRRSLIILDEIGRGTSTYDGLSIAWAVVEYIHNSSRLGAKTIFATHYHELVSLSHTLPRVSNHSMAVRDDESGVVFLRKVVPGGADRSYGVHVARLAGLPRSVLHRATQVLSTLERPEAKPHAQRFPGVAGDLSRQLPLFDDSAITQELLDLDIDSMSPREAITRLYGLQQKVKGTHGPAPQKGSSHKS